VEGQVRKRKLERDQAFHASGVGIGCGMKETEGLGCSTFRTSGVMGLDGGDSGRRGTGSVGRSLGSGGLVRID